MIEFSLQAEAKPSLLEEEREKHMRRCTVTFSLDSLVQLTNNWARNSHNNV